MPELPEVETIRGDLAPQLVGARVASVWTSGKALRLARPLDVGALRRASEGRRIVAVRRRAKYLLVDFDGGDVVVIHLGMSGRLRVEAAAAARAPHTHVVWALGKTELRFVDPRRFGNVLVAPRGRAAELPELADLGDEPLSLTAGRLHELAQTSRRGLKLFLLDQSRIAGLGNIYVCEALFHAGVHPNLPAHRLSAPRAAALQAAIVMVLEQGLANRGTTLRDYVDGSGAEGGNQHHLAVYDREGEACQRCRKGKIRRITTQGRGTFYCPKCQTR